MSDLSYPIDNHVQDNHSIVTFAPGGVEGIGYGNGWSSLLPSTRPVLIKKQLNIVSLSGLANRGTTLATDPTILTGLPTELRPEYDSTFIALAWNGDHFFCRIDVSATGVVSFSHRALNTTIHWVALDTIHYIT